MAASNLTGLAAVEARIASVGRLRSVTIFLDMDGVLCDFDTGRRAVTNLDDRKKMWGPIARHPNFYGTLSWLEEGREIYRWLTSEEGVGRVLAHAQERRSEAALERAPKLVPSPAGSEDAACAREADPLRFLRPVMLTGLPMGNWADHQKRFWVERHLEPNATCMTCMSRDKPQVAQTYLSLEGVRCTTERLQRGTGWSTVRPPFTPGTGAGPSRERNGNGKGQRKGRTKGVGNAATVPPPLPTRVVGGEPFQVDTTGRDLMILLDDNEKAKEDWQNVGGVFLHHKNDGASLEELQYIVQRCVETHGCAVIW